MIRLGNINDVNAINKLGNNLIDNFENKYKVSDYIDNQNYIILINEYDHINAFLIIFNNIDFYELEIIFVNLNDRGQGIATTLLNFFFENYYSKNRKDIVLEVAVDNDDAIKLYKKFGFEICNIRKKYYKETDAYVMKRVEK